MASCSQQTWPQRVGSAPTHTAPDSGQEHPSRGSSLQHSRTSSSSLRLVEVMPSPDTVLKYQSVPVYAMLCATPLLRWETKAQRGQGPAAQSPYLDSNPSGTAYPVGSADRTQEKPKRTRHSPGSGCHQGGGIWTLTLSPATVSLITAGPLPWARLCPTSLCASSARPGPPAARVPAQTRALLRHLELRRSCLHGSSAEWAKEKWGTWAGRPGTFAVIDTCGDSQAG